jgi:VanZ family protein
MAETSRIIGPILRFLFPAAPEETLQIYHAYIRKAAHFSEYAVLALLTFRALAGSASARLRQMRYLLPIVLVALIASVDEANQSFEVSRTGSAMDALLDISGGVVSLGMTWLVSRRPRK